MLSLCRDIFLVFLSAAYFLFLYGAVTLQVSFQVLHVENNKFWN